jgi:hypothetical protein
MTYEVLDDRDLPHKFVSCDCAECGDHRINRDWQGPLCVVCERPEDDLEVHPK